MVKFHVTYEVVTPESAEHGDVEETGFVAATGYHFDDPFDLRLREAVNLIGCVEDAGSWFVETDGRHDYRTGAETRYSLHPPRNITGASYSRLCRLLHA